MIKGKTADKICEDLKTFKFLEEESWECLLPDVRNMFIISWQNLLKSQRISVYKKDKTRIIFKEKLKPLIQQKSKITEEEEMTYIFPKTIA